MILSAAPNVSGVCKKIPAVCFGNLIGETRDGVVQSPVIDQLSNHFDLLQR